MKVWPLKFRDLVDGTIFADDAGGWFKSDRGFLDRYGKDQLAPDDLSFLQSNGHAYERVGDLSHTAFAWRWASRQAVASPLAYVILVPTLRCNLSCGYCQVSRAAETARGFDWSSETLKDVLRFLDRLETDQIKIEFQGGEPTLRLDLLEAVRDFCRKRFLRSEFVVCTNLQRLGAAEWSFLEAADTFTSTSVDGDASTHERQRTVSAALTDEFFGNLAMAAERLGPHRMSALPTIDPFSPPDFMSLCETYEQLGIASIYLRPVNHQGFARRRRMRSEEMLLWNRMHSDFIELLIRRNAETGHFLEEYYFTHALRRVLSAGLEHHVDIRNPNLFATDYVLVDFDGKLYPTDEARMLSRIGHVDLSVGHVATGIDGERRAAMNASSMNNFDPDCIHCPYQTFCGTDLIDDVSRYGRVDVPRHDTWFCQRHMALFDKVFELVYRDDVATRLSLARWAGVAEWPIGLARRHS
ncbi:MAG: His-Xaa-Ser system radical SAM maturase HxsB [Candidatus Kaistia colombiensis]|nr:MAG: His-Xaa-Ser system radical SAM maturase HxsB [Kaistia sp.]